MNPRDYIDPRALAVLDESGNTLAVQVHGVCESYNSGGFDCEDNPRKCPLMPACTAVENHVNEGLPLLTPRASAVLAAVEEAMEGCVNCGDMCTMHGSAAPCDLCDDAGDLMKAIRKIWSDA